MIENRFVEKLYWTESKIINIKLVDGGLILKLVMDKLSAGHIIAV